MFVTVTTSHPTPEELQIIKPFMAGFLPRLRKVPGVVNVFFSVRPDKGDETTFIVWENTAAIQTYRESALFLEAVEFEKKFNLSSTREGYPISDPE